MLLEFSTPIEGCGDAFETDGVGREDLIHVCVALAHAVERMAKELAEAEAEPEPGATEERKLTLAVMTVISRAGVSQWQA